jgi:hypothetical protein
MSLLSASLYRLASYRIGVEGKALIREALQGKVGFELLF